MRKIGEEMFPVDLSLQAKETVKAHLCLCTWQPADLCTHGHRGIIIFSIGCGSGFISLFGVCSNVHFVCFQTDGTDGIVFLFFSEHVRNVYHLILVLESKSLGGLAQPVFEFFKILLLNFKFR